MRVALPRPLNRLSTERSVYLQQHARNPVDWHPWGAEALAAARARGVPLFVSVGYSTCYWCHVMERESFEDAATAELLNRVSVPVKVDREERPDLDDALMTACQVFTQLTEGRASGGWPLNAFLHPETLEPFFCGTYFPTEPAHGRPGFRDLLRAVEAAWRADPEGLRAQGARIAALAKAHLEPGGDCGAPPTTNEEPHVRRATERAATAERDDATTRAAPSVRDAPTERDAAAARATPATPGASAARATPDASISPAALAALRALAAPGLAEQVVETIMRAADPANGGFGGAPKFPTPPYPTFLFETRRADSGVTRALRHMLDRMAIGGIRDQIGGGFHRYSVDAEWTVPHFEKMLYDNALLAVLYTRAAAEWGDAYFARVARETLDWILREMTGEHGQFFSAQDAEVAGREGANYIWTAEEIRSALGGVDSPRDAPHALAHPPRDAMHTPLDRARDAPSRPDAAFALRVYGVDRGPNFRDPHHPDAPPASVLRLNDRSERVAAVLGMTDAEFAERLARVNAALLAVRAARPQPLTDDKTIAAWTGLAMEAFALAGKALAEPRFTAAAERAARFVLDRMRAPDGGLLRIWRGGTAAIPGFLEDHACVANGLLALGWEREAAELMRRAHAEFADLDTGAWFDVGAGRNELWARGRSLDDGAVPSGTSSALRALAMLAGGALAPAERAEFRAWAVALAAAVAPAVLEQPVSASGTVLAARHLAALVEREATVDHPVPVRMALHWTPGAREAVLELAIAPGHHVTAGEAFAVHPADGTPSAWIIEAVPAPHTSAASAGEKTGATPTGGITPPGALPSVWEGTVRVPIAFAAPPLAPPALSIHWQVCTDRACLPPQTTVVRAATLPRCR